jgi:hypothetical protein
MHHTSCRGHPRAGTVQLLCGLSFLPFHTLLQQPCVLLQCRRICLCETLHAQSLGITTRTGLTQPSEKTFTLFHLCTLRLSLAATLILSGISPEREPRGLCQVSHSTAVLNSGAASYSLPYKQDGAYHSQTGRAHLQIIKGSCKATLTIMHATHQLRNMDKDTFMATENARQRSLHLSHRHLNQ